MTSWSCKEVSGDLALCIHHPVPEDHAVMVKAAFPKGNLYVELHTEFGAVYDDDQCADPMRRTVGDWLRLPRGVWPS